MENESTQKDSPTPHTEVSFSVPIPEAMKAVQRVPLAVAIEKLASRSAWWRFSFSGPLTVNPGEDIDNLIASAVAGLMSEARCPKCENAGIKFNIGLELYKYANLIVKDACCEEFIQQIAQCIHSKTEQISQEKGGKELNGAADCQPQKQPHEE